MISEPIISQSKERASGRTRNFYNSERERRKGKWCKEWKRETSVHPHLQNFFGYLLI
jgi:hypothetical protein